MDYLKDFVIPFKGLNTGEHEFDFRIEKKFFEQFEFGELRNGEVSIKLFLLKDETMLTLNFIIDGKIEVDCDRCGEEFFQPIKGEERLFIKFGQEGYDESEEIVVIPADEYEIDLSHFIYEFIVLLLPYRKVHPKDAKGEDQCNQEVINRLNNQSNKSSTDPRWEALKELKTKNKNK